MYKFDFFFKYKNYREKNDNIYCLKWILFISGFKLKIIFNHITKTCFLYCFSAFYCFFLKQMILNEKQILCRLYVEGNSRTWISCTRGLGGIYLWYFVLLISTTYENQWWFCDNHRCLSLGLYLQLVYTNR